MKMELDLKLDLKLKLFILFSNKFATRKILKNHGG